MPVVHPADVWRDSGRYDKIGPELVRFKDRGGRDMVLAMTHEEVVALLLARHRPELSPAAGAASTTSRRSSATSHAPAAASSASASSS